MSRYTVSLLLCLLALAALTLSAPASSKISPSLAKTLQSKAKARVNILVAMREGTEATLKQVSALNARATRAERATAVYKSLKALSETTQAPVLALLRSPRFFTLEVRSFWITNQIYVQGADESLINALAAMDEVSYIDEEQVIRLEKPELKPKSDNSVMAEWGVEKIQAPEAWAAAGTDGEGTVIGIVDTGARVTHQDLRESFRGGDHSWYNPYSVDQSPSDGFGTGTFATGVAVGAGGIGVAPGAKWIACKGFTDDGVSSDANLIRCGEFMACPHDYMGSNPDCSLAPDVSSNSWGMRQNPSQVWYDDVVRAYHAAGIIPVFANGNDGPACATGWSPADSIADVIAVGATSQTDSLAEFSSRGPGSVTGFQTPDIAAPGVEIVSAAYTDDAAYAVGSGTSMAAPHVAGVIALLRSANPDISYLQTKNILQDNADRELEFSGQVCLGFADNVWPNYGFGYGRLNALRAVEALKKLNRSQAAA